MSVKDIWTSINKSAFFISLISSVGLLVAGFIVPPLGIIHPSVLEATGILAFYGVLATIQDAIKKGKSVTLSKGDIDVTVGGDKKENGTN
jgi:hypothetical protein